jgi:anti-sigma B factor antagonist
MMLLIERPVPETGARRDEPMSFSIERRADVTIVRIVDQLVATDRLELRPAVLGELADGARTIRFDFARATYIDGAGLGLLVAIARLTSEHAALLRLANLNEDLRTLFMLTKLDTLFTIERDDDDGGSALRSAPPSPRAPGPWRGPAEERPRP